MFARVMATLALLSLATPVAPAAEAPDCVPVNVSFGNWLVVAGVGESCGERPWLTPCLPAGRYDAIADVTVPGADASQITFRFSGPANAETASRTVANGPSDEFVSAWVPVVVRPVGSADLVVEAFRDGALLGSVTASPCA